MISIATDLRAQILLMPIIKQQMIIVFLLGPAPGIERFIHYNYAHSIAKIEQFRRGRVVARADGVDAHLFQNLYLAFQCSRIDCRTKCSQIMMIANAVESDVLTIEQESFIYIKLDCTNSKDSLLGVDDPA